MRRRQSLHGPRVRRREAPGSRRPCDRARVRMRMANIPDINRCAAPVPHAGPCVAAEVAAGPAPGRCVLDSRAGHEAQWASLGRTRLASFTAGLP